MTWHINSTVKYQLQFKTPSREDQSKIWMMLQWHMLKQLQLARSPGKQEAETNCNYMELGVVGLPPSESGVK